MATMRPASRIVGVPPVEWNTITSEEAAMLARFAHDDRPGWHWRAACAFTDPSVFFPGKGEPTIYAKRICGGCEVRQECLDEALADDLEHGVWGGLSPQERRKLNPPSRQAFKLERAAEIRRLSAEGWSSQALGEKYGLATAAVRKLVASKPDARRKAAS